MEGLPPLPPGFVLETAPPPPPKKRADPWEVLKAEGFVATNGFRTKGDVERIRAQGYKPASNGAHNRGDGIDLDHPSLTPAQQTQRLRELFGDWEGAFIDDEGHHRHMQLPGWGAAPGTPGTPNSGLPPVPEGFELVQRGSINESNFVSAPVADPNAARIATIKQNGFPPAEEARLIAAAREEAPLVDGAASVVAFNDELPETPASQLAPNQIANFYKLAQDPNSTADDLRALMRSYGRDLSNADEIVAARNKGLGVNANLIQKVGASPKNADAATGAAARGFADPINVLDDVGAVVDTLGGTAGRENVWNSERGFGDILYNNIDANRGVLKADERDHFEARFGGQLASGILLPFGAGARGAGQLARFGAIEGGLSGFGAGEGNPLQRAPNALAGAGIGAVGGYALGRVIDDVAPMLRNAFARPAPVDVSAQNVLAPVARESAYRAAPVVNDGLQAAGPTPAARTQRQGGMMGNRMDMAADIDARSISARVDDLPPIPKGFVIDAPAIGIGSKGRPDGGSENTRMGISSDSSGIGLPVSPARVERGIGSPLAEVRAPLGSSSTDDLPPIPEGFVLDEPGIGRIRPMGERVSPEEVADLARGVNPEDVRPIPANWVESPDELPTSLRTIEGPDSPGRAPKRPVRFSETLKARLAADTAQAGVPVRIDAEDAINNGVPAELIYRNPDVVDKAQLQLRNPSLFGTRYGKMSANEQVLRSLDMDDVDPVEWGFDNLAGQRLGPEAIGDLLRRDLEGDPSALQRGGAYDAWTAHQERAAQRAEFADRYPDGVPVEQAGETISLDDLNALQPPASAYEDRPRFTGIVGNINLDRLESPEDVSRLIQQVQGKVGGFDEAKRGVVTNEETRALADELGLRPEDLLQRRRGQALNAEQMYATRVLVQKSREVVGRLAKQAVGGSDERVAAFRNAWMRHVALEEQVTAATAEVGRAMQSFKMLAKAGDAKGQAVKAYLNGGGGRETVEEAAQKLVDLMEDPAAANTFLRNGAKATTRDMINEFWINSLLSGPRTHVVNFVSNGLVALYTLPEQLLTAGVGAALRTEGRVTVREVGRRAVGMIQGAREGLHLAKRALVTGEPYDAISKVEAANYEAIPNFGRKVTVPAAVPLFGGVKTTTLPVGSLIRTPARFLTASDELWKAINRGAETHALAYRQALARGGTPEQRLENYRELVLNPTGNMMKQADAAARFTRSRRSLGLAARLCRRSPTTSPSPSS